MIVDVVDDCLACMVVYINMVDVESLTGPVAIERAVNVSLEAVESAGLTTTLAHFKLSSQGITITDSKHRSLRRIVLFLRIPIPDPVYHHAWVLFLGSKHVRLSICCCVLLLVRPSVLQNICIQLTHHRSTCLSVLATMHNYSPTRTLRSTNQFFLDVPRFSTEFGKRSFSYT